MPEKKWCCIEEQHMKLKLWAAWTGAAGGATDFSSVTPLSCKIQPLFDWERHLLPHHYWSPPSVGSDPAADGRDLQPLSADQPFASQHPRELPPQKLSIDNHTHWCNTTRKHIWKWNWILFKAIRLTPSRDPRNRVLKYERCIKEAQLLVWEVKI